MKHERFDTGSAEPVETVALGSGSASTSAPGGASGTTRKLDPNQDPRMRAYVDG